MKRFALTLLAVGLLSASAHGFETKSGTVAPAKPGQGGSALDLESQKVPAPNKGKSGFELPGLGNLGVLPKLDFGLELLYGEAPAPTSPEKFERRDTDPEDLTIKGTFKHRF